MATKITIDTGKKKVKLTLSEAERIYYELHNMFGKPESIPYHPYPAWPNEIKPYNPLESPYKITCGSIRQAVFPTIHNQEPLGAGFSAVLHDNLEDLYEVGGSSN